MQTQRRIDGSPLRARAADIGLWHLGAGLLVVGGALGATIGLPPLPPALIISLDRLGPSDLARALEQARPPSALLAALPTLPTLVDVELFFRSPSAVQLDAAGVVISWVAWALWLWLLATAVLRVVVVLGERAAGGARWAARLRRLSDRITLSLVRQAVDATLAGELILRAAVPTPAPVSVPQIGYAHIWWNRIPDRVDSPVASASRRVAMAPDLQAGDTLYTVQQGDSLSGIAERFYADPTAFTRIVEANLHREQPDGRTLRDARFIYPGWRLLVPEPTQTVYTDPDGQRWYTVRAGDTLSGISARLLGDPERYRELFADNQGVELGDGHVLTNPNLIWPGLHLRLPPEVALDDAPQPPSPVVPTPAPATSLPATAAAPAPGGPDANGQPTSTGDGHGDAVATGLDDHREPTPAPSPLPPDLPAAGAPGEQPPPPGRAWGTDGLAIDLGVAGGLTVAAALLVLQARRRRRAAPEPESDTRVDAQAFTVAEPATVAGGRAAGTLDDPHGIVLGELLAGELVRRARVAELADVQVICVMAGRSGSVVTLSVPLQDRPLLEAALRTETQLARRIDVSRSPEQDIVVRLQGVRREALARVSLHDCPVLLCLGMLPDSRSCLVGWDALGHVLVASQPGTTDAEQHLAALVATLAGQLSPADLHLYTVARENSGIRQLIPLPHQRAATIATDAEALTEILADLRREVERRQLAGDGAKDPQLVLVVSELADVWAHEDLAFLLSHGKQFGVRVVGATADSAVERGSLVDQFSSHLVFGLQDEEASTRLLGAPWALTLAEPGRLLVRIGGRKEVEALGLHLTEDGCRALLASMGVTGGVSPSDLLESVSVLERESESRQEVSADEADNRVAAAPDIQQDSPARLDGEGLPGELLPSAGSEVPNVGAKVEQRDSEERSSEPSSGSRPDHLVIKSDETTSTPGGAIADGPPERIRRLLARAPLVVDCEEASVWSTRGRLAIGQSSPVEVLVYLAAAPLLHQGAMAEWPGVDPETLLAEIWAPRARDPGNRDSAQAWLAKNLGRLQDEIERATGEPNGQIVVKQRGGLHLNDEVVISDLEAFMAAIERARAAHGADHISVAEEAFGTRVPGLLSRVVRKPKTTGPRVEFYRWLGEPHWERAARRLDALEREAAMLVARAYREAGRHEEALAIYDELLGEDPLDRRAREGLLIAAAGTHDMVRLQQAWQQVCACLGGEDDAARILYERLRCEVSCGGNCRNGVSGIGQSRAAVRRPLA